MALSLGKKKPNLFEIYCPHILNCASLDLELASSERRIYSTLSLCVWEWIWAVMVLSAMRGLSVFISNIRNCSNKEQERLRVDKELNNVCTRFKNKKVRVSFHFQLSIYTYTFLCVFFTISYFSFPEFWISFVYLFIILID